MNLNHEGERKFTPVPIMTAGEQITMQFVQALAIGSLKPHDKLPGEKELADEFGVSRKTIRDGLLNLQEMGIVTSYRGKSGGTFISDFPYSDL